MNSRSSDPTLTREAMMGKITGNSNKDVKTQTYKLQTQKQSPEKLSKAHHDPKLNQENTNTS